LVFVDKYLEGIDWPMLAGALPWPEVTLRSRNTEAACPAASSQTTIRARQQDEVCNIPWNAVNHKSFGGTKS
jgi:hypothetical protein